MLQDDGLKERLSALYALIDWIKNGTMLREHALSPFAKELALGVCRRHLRLQHAIKKNVHRMPSVEVQCVLEMGIYQIFFMNVPSHAAVDSSAELARRASLGEGSVKLVNGVLRGLEREGLPTLPAQNVQRISIEYSLPEWIVRRLLDGYGSAHAEGFAKETVERPSQWIRVNTCRISASELKEKLMLSGRIYKDRYLEVIEGANEPHLVELLKSDFFEKGLFSVQNPAAYEVARLLNVEENMTVWDACAAPGGKSALLAEDNPTAKILASDVSEERLRPMAVLTRRLKLSNVEVQTVDATKCEFVDKFDRVLLDVPCSNLGVLSRRPEVKYRLTQNDLKELPKLQFEILEASSAAVKKGGELVYATCSPDRAETDKVVQKFLEKHPDFEKKEEIRIGQNAFGLDHFFAASLRRKS